MKSVQTPPPSPGTPPTSFPSADDPHGPAHALGVADLHAFLHGFRSIDERPAPPRTLELASSLYRYLLAQADGPADLRATLQERIVTDTLIREECDRDQNVYLGELFTRFLTRAVPDVLFLPAGAGEVAAALLWARANGVQVTLRGAASTALGGSVPNDGGLTLDLSRLDRVDVNPDDNVCVVGGGARLREIHTRLAAHDLALPVYPSNLGGTFAGWLVTGAIGLNAFGLGGALDIVRAADVVLPSGELVRLHADGRLDVPADEPHRSRRELPRDQREDWFRRCGLPPFGLSDLVGSEGVLGAVVQLVLTIGRRPQIGAFLLGFEQQYHAHRAAAWITAASCLGGPSPANLKLVLASHLATARRVWADAEAHPWRRLPSALSSGDGMPWSSILPPSQLGVPPQRLADERFERRAAAFLYVDFLDPAVARAFAARLGDVPGAPQVLEAESVRVAADRFRPQQNKRLGPGLLAAEIELPAEQVEGFLREAARLSANAGVHLEPEVYFGRGGRALAIAGYLTDHRTAAFNSDLALAPALLDFAIRRYQGRPYVLGRWQSSFAVARFGEDGLRRLQEIKAGLDPQRLLGRGVLFGLELRGLPGAAVAAAYKPGVSLLGRLWQLPVAGGAARVARAALSRLPGPAYGHGEPLPAAAQPTARAIHCVNCGECNAVCPVYHWSTIRLPQILTHWGEGLHAGHRDASTVPVLLDLCMRCGNCEQVCQSGINHLQLYNVMATGADGGRNSAQRRQRILTTVRASSRYRSEFLNVRPGMYLRRSPASLSGTVRYLVLRAENEDGPAASCLHCAACVPVCPTGANREYAADDARLVTTDESACVGCGVCVEVCPANRSNGGQTLRVVEAPSAEWQAALAESEPRKAWETES